MDGFQEKKWFLYLGDHHEGPFSLAEIQEKMTAGQVTTLNYVWAEGMGDWRPMTDVPEFSIILKSTSSTVQTSSEVPKEPSVQISLLEVPKSGPEVTLTKEIPQAFEPSLSVEPKRLKLGWVKWVAALGVVSGIGITGYKGYLPTDKIKELLHPLVIKCVEKAPFLSSWISPIANLEDVKPDDYELLKKAAIASFKNEGPQVSIALSQTDVNAPSFWVVSNMPDGFIFDVYLEGVPESLLNATEYFSKSQALMMNRIGKTSVFKHNNGPIPKGRYKIFMTESEKIPDEAKPAFEGMRPAITELPAGIPRDRKLIIKKTIFLGGSEDVQYQTRLKEYHEKLKQEADRELSELAQYITTLEEQTVATNKEFLRIKKIAKSSLLQKKLWSTHHEQWSKLFESMDQQIKQWTPETMKGFFYGPMYASLQTISQAVQRVHQINESFFVGIKDIKAFDIQREEAMSQVQMQLGQLKVKLEEMQKLPPTPNGMPRRDGL